jgi:hypothetical protein
MMQEKDTPLQHRAIGHVVDCDCVRCVVRSMGVGEVVVSCGAARIALVIDENPICGVCPPVVDRAGEPADVGHVGLLKRSNMSVRRCRRRRSKVRDPAFNRVG